jgi:HSP20 family protein
MSIVRWDPFGDVDVFFNRLLPAARWPRFALENDSGKAAAWAPSVDISETDQEFLINAELPAVKKEDLHVTVDQGMLTIRGERQQLKENKGEKLHRRERMYGSFERTFSLPDNINAEAIRCESRDGVLTVHLPKAAQTKSGPKQISVQ